MNLAIWVHNWPFQVSSGASFVSSGKKVYTTRHQECTIYKIEIEMRIDLQKEKSMCDKVTKKPTWTWGYGLHICFSLSEISLGGHQKSVLMVHGICIWINKWMNEKISCAHQWGQYTPALITTHLIQKYPIKISILQSCASQVGILQKKMNWANRFFQKVAETPFSAKYLATRGPKMRLGTRKCRGIKRLTP